MKLLDYVKKEPTQAYRSILVLSVAFLTCFGALIAIGIGGACVYKNGRERAAELLAADLLALRESVRSGDEAGAHTFAAVVTVRAGDFLSTKEAMRLAELIKTADVRFFMLCDTVEKTVKECTFSVSAFRHALHLCDETGGVGTLREASARGQAPKNPYVSLAPAADYTAQAAEFVGVRNIFASDGECAYCRNLCVRFFPGTDRIRFFAVSCVAKESHYTQNECVSAAAAFVTTRIAMRSAKITSIKYINGIYRVCFESDRDGGGVAGVRADTGSIVYFFRQTKSEAAHYLSEESLQ